MRGLQALFFFGAYLCVRGTGEPPLVDTKLGQLLGKTIPFSPRHLKLSGEVSAFVGVPYAKPPIGERRFGLPEPVDPWEGTLNATVTPSACPQIREPGYRMSEDCLFLNVFVPATAPPNATVMVFIHGGSLILGSGHDFPIDPVPLAAIGDVIVVTLNYRLNIFGFFTSGDDAIPANLGLRDQRLALQWVNENIEVFGGDPGKVTVFGESSGSASVAWHVVVEESRKYFQRAIMQSGTPYAPWANVLSDDEIGEAFPFIAGLGGCAGDTATIAECLKAKSVEELLTIHGTVDAILAGAPIWVPANDGDFFPTDAYSAIPSGDYSGIEVIVGTMEDEGTFDTYIRTGFTYSQPNVTRDQFSYLAASSVDPLQSGLLEAVYSAGIDATGNYEGALSSALGDMQFTCATNEFSKQLATGGATVYQYRMTMEPVRSLFNATWLKASHGEDLQFVFGLPFLDHPVYRPVYKELKFSYYIMQIWANFAKSGNPNVFPGIIPEWPQFIPDSEIYRELDLGFANNHKLRQHYCNFWESLLPQIVSLQATVAEDDMA